MLQRRLGYGGFLIFAVLLQIFYVGYLSTFLLVLAIVFPRFSLALSLPGMLGCALTISAEAPTVERGAESAFLVTLTNRARLPLSQATVRCSYVNQFTGDRLVSHRAFRGASGGATLREDVTAHHCGVLVCRVESLRVCDLLGLFSFRRRRPAPASLLVCPIPVALDAPPELLGGTHDGTSLRPRPGGGPGEDYDLRPYRAGDPMRSVHWKLSSKLDELVVRETLEAQRAALVLSFDHFGTPSDLDSTLDQLYSLSRYLLTKERPHHVQWAEPVTGAVQSCFVPDERGLLACLAAVCAAPAPPTGRSILDAPICVAGSNGSVRHLHIAPEGGAL